MKSVVYEKMLTDLREIAEIANAAANALEREAAKIDITEFYLNPIVVGCGLGVAIARGHLGESIVNLSEVLEDYRQRTPKGHS